MPSSLSLRGVSGAVRLLKSSGSPRAFGPRDDKGGVGAKCLSLRGRSGATDAAIHRVSGDAGGVDGSVTGSQWIATPARGSR